MDFKKQLKSPKWQKKRLEILERDAYCCQNCGDEENQLHVHHYIYHKNKMLWEYDPKYLITFCDSCHEEWHETYNLIKEQLCADIMVLNEIHDIIDLTKNYNLFDLAQLRRVIQIITTFK